MTEIIIAIRTEGGMDTSKAFDRQKIAETNHRLVMKDLKGGDLPVTCGSWPEKTAIKSMI